MVKWLIWSVQGIGGMHQSDGNPRSSARMRVSQCAILYGKILRCACALVLFVYLLDGRQF